MNERRTFIKLPGKSANGADGVAGFSERRGPLSAAEASNPSNPLDGIARSLRQEHDYAPRVDGKLPEELRGTLYRNGPGLFERGNVRRRHLLDGDGMIQALDLGGGTVRYRNRFVRTDKYVAEESAGRFLFPTWSTLAPGGWLRNIGYPAKSQAGVTSVLRDGKLLAFDDFALPYALDPDSLQTLGEFRPGGATAFSNYNAHSKIDGENGDWILFGQVYGRHMTVNVLIIGNDGAVKARLSEKVPRYTYLHDCFVTARYVVFNLHALNFSPYLMLLGLRSTIDSFTWTPQEGNLLLVLDKHGVEPPRYIEAPAAFMWHSLNAYERGDSIVGEFVGYDDPDHFLGGEAWLATIMQGRPGKAVHPGTVRRYVINLKQNRVNQEILAHDSYEFPIVNPHRLGHRYRNGYFTYSARAALQDTGIARMDMLSGQRELFDFGHNFLVGEPVFAPRPGVSFSGDEAVEEGWLLSQVFDVTTQTSFFAVFDAAHLADGPIARILLEHHVPISFHGCWRTQCTA